ncbi:hypothetical protein Tco_1095512 [Tanacetum coccineum]
MAFVLSPSSTIEVNTAYRVSTANTQVSPASTQVSTASTQVTMEAIDGVGFDRANMADSTRLIGRFKYLQSRKGCGVLYSYNVIPPPLTGLFSPKVLICNSGLVEFNSLVFEGYGPEALPKAVNTVRPNSAVVNVVRANQVNAVKASACWVWRPTKLNSASITLKRHNYVDARGRSKSVMAWVPTGN